jgi:hypothetical protein
MKKHFALIFIQIAWPCETIAVLLFTMWAVVCLPTEQVNLWLQFIPAFGLLIGAQGTAAGGGPLVADAIKSRKGE